MQFNVVVMNKINITAHYRMCRGESVDLHYVKPTWVKLMCIKLTSFIQDAKF